MATGREGLAPTDNQYLKKCIKEDITITLKFQVYSLLERYGEGIDKSL